MAHSENLLKQAEAQEQELELVTIESQAPADHLLRKIDAMVDVVKFIWERVRHIKG